MNITVLYVGSSLLAPLRNAEREINRKYGLDLRLAVRNFGSQFTEDEWQTIESDLAASEIVFVIHVMDGENAGRLLPLLDRYRSKTTIIVINCMPELMKRTRVGKLDFAKLPGVSSGRAQRAEGKEPETSGVGNLVKGIASWIGRQTRNGKSNGHGRADYLKWAERLPGLLRLVPNAGRLRDAKNYLLVVSYFLQPTPNNIQSMILLALKEYAAGDRLRSIDIAQPEALPAVAIYHPDAHALFESFEAYETWYNDHLSKAKDQRPKSNDDPLDPNSTIGLLLMRPQIVSNSRKHYDGLIRAIEAEGFSVIPAISTLMDNREACGKFFIDARSKARSPKPKVPGVGGSTNNGQP